MFKDFSSKRMDRKDSHAEGRIRELDHIKSIRHIFFPCWSYRLDYAVKILLRDQFV